MAFTLSERVSGDPRQGVWAHVSRDHPGKYFLIERTRFRRVASGYGTLAQAESFIRRCGWTFLGTKDYAGLAPPSGSSRSTRQSPAKFSLTPKSSRKSNGQSTAADTDRRLAEIVTRRIAPKWLASLGRKTSKENAGLMDWLIGHAKNGTRPGHNDPTDPLFAERDRAIDEIRRRLTGSRSVGTRPVVAAGTRLGAAALVRKEAPNWINARGSSHQQERVDYLISAARSGRRPTRGNLDDPNIRERERAYDLLLAKFEAESGAALQAIPPVARERDGRVKTNPSESGKPSAMGFPNPGLRPGALSSTDRRGEVIGTRRVYGLIAEGAWAKVYLVYNDLVERWEVIKLLSYFRSDRDSRDRFRTEAQAIKDLRHPNIVKLHDVGTYQESPFLVLEWIEGGSLEELLGTSTFGLASRSCEVVSDVSEALDYAHAHGVIHRDVKPSNILLRGTQAVLADFGIAKLVATTSSLTRTGQSLGTPQYMAPEQCRIGKSVSFLADVYSLGCVAYELLSGSPPFVGDPMTVMHAHIYDTAARPSVHNPNVTPVIDEVIMTALEKDPHSRFGSAREFATALTAAYYSA